MKTLRAPLAAVILMSASVGSALPAAAPPEKTAPSKGTVVFRVSGVLAKRARKGKNKVLLPGFVQSAVKPGDIVRTRAHSRAEVHLGGGVIIRLRENSVLKIAKFESKKKAVDVSLRLVAGKILLKIEKAAGINKRVRVRTATAVASVRGTVFVVDAAKPTGTEIKVLEGLVHTAGLAGGKESAGRDVGAGQEISVVEGQPDAEPAAMSAEELAQETGWSREAEMEVAGGDQENGVEPGEEVSGEKGAAEPETPEIIEPESNGSEAPEIEESEPGEPEE